MSQSDRDQVDEIRRRRLQLLSGEGNQNTVSTVAAQGYPIYAPSPNHTSNGQSFFQHSPGLVPLPNPNLGGPSFFQGPPGPANAQMHPSLMGASFGNAPYQPFPTTGMMGGHPTPGPPSPFGFAPYAPLNPYATAGHVLSNPYGHSLSHHGYSASAGRSTMGSPPVPAGMPTPSPSSRGDEEMARKLQDMYDAEELSLPLGASPPLWPNSPFKSDEEYALSLAEGFNQQDGNPLPSHTAAEVPKLPSVEADEEFARQLQKELDSGGRRADENYQQTEYSHGVKPFSADIDKEPVEIDLQVDLEPLLTFGQNILSSRCANCAKHLLYGEKDVIKLTKDWLDKQGRADSVLLCPKCSKHTCIGCGKLHKSHKSSSPSLLSGKPTKGQEIDITMCCQEGRLFLIWAFLCAADHQKSCSDRRDAFFSKSRPRRTISDPTRGRAMKMSNGTGYGGQDGVPYVHGAYHAGEIDDDPDELMFISKARRRALPPQPAPTLKENTEDVLLTQVFTALTKLLPALMDKGHPFEDPPEILAVMLRRSPVLEKAADFLRNDSLDDITQRHKLYSALLSFVERLANHPATAQTIFGQRIIYPADAGLLSASFNDNRYELRSSDKGKFKAETSRPLSKIAMQLEVSARKMLQQSKAAEEDFQTPEGKNMLHLCGEICELARFLDENFYLDRKANNDEVTYTGKGKEPCRPQEDMTKWHREHCVDEVPDSVFENTFYFWKEATANQGNPPKGRMKSLMTDLATLQTSLPEGIYVRHGASRLDMMKVLIVGPKGTPYEGGLFEFDLFCPLNYPSTPPKMQFKTTGGGVAHFNPNLYADGKVCLSLLGTWSGQPWIASGPNKSTLLQLCISIQSMILCDEPWYNEPGRELHPNPAASVDYNMFIQALTLQHALTSWLERKNVSDPIWKEVIEKHFRFNSQAIVDTVRAWSKSAEEHKTVDRAPRPELNPFIGHFAPGMSRGATRIPTLAKDFEKALQSTFGIVNMGNGILLGGGEGKRKFGV